MIFNLKEKFFFLTNFGLAKLVTYAVPLVIASVAPSNIYGAIELGWAFSLLVAAIIIGTPLAGINHRFIIDKDSAVLDELALITASGALVALILWCAGNALGLRVEWLVAFASLGVAVLHNVVSALFRMRGDRNLTAWFDGTATISAGLIILVLWLVSSRLEVVGLSRAYALAVVVIGVAGAVSFFGLRKPGIARRIKRSGAIGLPMLAGGILAMWLGIGGRMIIGFIDPALVATYSVMFRVAGVALGIHQLAVTAIFARVYGARTREADRLLFPFLAGVTVLMAIISAATPPLIHLAAFEALAGEGEDDFRRALPIVGIQVYYWIAFAMLQMRINRSGLASRAFAPTLLVALGGTALIVGAAKLFDLGLTGLCWGLALHSAAFYAVEWIVLARARLPHIRLGWCSLVGGSGLTIIAIINQIARSAG
jgi:hypothetical protein